MTNHVLFLMTRVIYLLTFLSRPTYPHLGAVNEAEDYLIAAVKAIAHRCRVTLEFLRRQKSQIEFDSRSERYIYSKTPLYTRDIHGRDRPKNTISPARDMA